MRRVIPIVICALAIVGLTDSVFLAFEHFYITGSNNSIVASACPLNNDSCKAAIASNKTALYGIPNAVLGSAYFALLLGFAIARVITGRWFVPKAFLAILIAGLLFSIYLTYTLIFVIGAPCPYCLTAHAVNLTIFALLLLSLRADRTGRALSSPF